MWTYQFQENDFQDAFEGLRPFADIYWYAEDRRKRLGLFCSAGFGAIPLESLQHFDSHKELSTQLFGDCKIRPEQDVDCGSSIGLYVYDWEQIEDKNLIKTPYIRLGSPTTPILTNAIDKHLQKCVVKLDVLYDVSPKVYFHEINYSLNL